MMKKKKDLYINSCCGVSRHCEGVCGDTVGETVSALWNTDTFLAWSLFAPRSVRFSASNPLAALHSRQSSRQLHRLHLPVLFSDQAPGALAQQLALLHWFISSEQFSAARRKQKMNEIAEKKLQWERLSRCLEVRCAFSMVPQFPELNAVFIQSLLDVNVVANNL